MKRFLWASAAVLLFLAGYFTSFWLANPSNSVVQAVFSPDETENVLMQIISSASQNVDIMLYQFSYSPLQQALIQAVNRGVRVRVILDRKINANLYTADLLAQEGVEVRWASPEYASTHAKFLIADGQKVFVGSPNWSRHAMKLNREAAAWITDVSVARDFLNVFEKDWSKANPWRS